VKEGNVGRLQRKVWQRTESENQLVVKFLSALNKPWTTLEEDYILTWGPVLKPV
jgi:hypothetical protein